MHVFASRRNPNLPHIVMVDGVRREFQFQNHRFETEDDALAAAIDEEIRTRPAVSALIYRVDVALGEEIVAQHRASQRQRAAQGPFTTGHAQLLHGRPDVVADHTKDMSPGDALAFADSLKRANLVPDEAGDPQPGDAGIPMADTETVELPPPEAPKPASRFKLGRRSG